MTDAKDGSDPEAAAIAQSLRVLGKLESDARMRVLNYLVNRYKNGETFLAAAGILRKRLDESEAQWRKERAEFLGQVQALKTRITELQGLETPKAAHPEADGSSTDSPHKVRRSV